MQGSDIKKGDLFIFRPSGYSMHKYLEGRVGIFLGEYSSNGLYKVQVLDKTLWLMRQSIEVLDEER